MFKIPFFNNIADFHALLKWLSEIYNRLAGGNLIKHIVVDIPGTWNMDLTPSITVSWKSVVATFSFKGVISAKAMIYNDDLTERYDATSIDWGIEEILVDSTTTSVTIKRRAMGYFDNSNFDSTTLIKRGELTLCLLT